MKTFYDNDINKFKNYIETSDHSDFSLDLTSMNIFDGLQFLVVSSAYFSQKFPDKKLKCQGISDDIKTLIKNFRVHNLEFV